MDEMNSNGDSKMEAGVKRRGEEREEDSNVSRKHVKMRDLQSIFQSEGIDTHESESEMSRLEESEEHMEIVETQSSQVFDKNPSDNAESRQLEVVLKKSSTLLVDRSLMPLNLNAEVCTGESDAVVSLENSKSLYGNLKEMFENNRMSFSRSDLDFNAEDVSSSADHDSFSSYKTESNLQTRDSCGSGKSTGCLEDNDSLRKWKEMKKNGFMSSAFGFGGITAAPKQHGRKIKNKVLKRKKEKAKKEHVDMFTKMAAPSGLLNGLNPGIINHVRNSKQVHSIIQALLRSEKRENSRQAKPAERNQEQDNLNLSGEDGSDLSYVSSMRSMPENSLLTQNQFSHCSSLFNSDDKAGYRNFVIEESGRAQPSLLPCSKIHNEDDSLNLKLTSVTKVSESTSSVSNEESANGSSVDTDTLSVKAATVASQWLQFLHQDINRRLAALHHSKKRVQAVITTELPFLLSKEFPPKQWNDPDSTSGYSIKKIAELHESRWSKLFDQMDSTLSEEEKQLESWLNQVNEMMLHCDQGLRYIQLNSILKMQDLGTADKNSRWKLKDPDKEVKELPVRAAAASIYSTCNFLSAREDFSCC